LISASSNNVLPVGQALVETRLKVNGLFKKGWLYHLLFWILYYFFLCVVLYNAYQIHDFTFYIQFILFMPVSAALVYSNFYILIPLFLYRKKYLTYALFLLLALLSAAFSDQLLKLWYAHLGSKLLHLLRNLIFQTCF
jgi:hypothetical protein